MINLRTDLAMEAREMFANGKDKNELPGVKLNKRQKGETTISEVEITDKESAEILKKPQGKYITIESKRLKSMEPIFLEEISYILKDELLKIIKLNAKDTVLVAGLGNHNITPDALGPMVVSKTMVTRHLKEYAKDLIDDDIRGVSAISPGVLGITGIETSDIILSVVKKVNPDLVILIDALASNSPERIGTTIQITNTGISPGSGVLNKRKALDYETLGVPVVAIGVPMVVDAVSIATEITGKFFSQISSSRPELNKLIEALKENGEEKLMGAFLEDELMVTPKEVDSLISHLSTAIANGINLSLHKGIDLEYIESFTF